MNGQKTDYRVTNYTLMTVPLPAGTHQVEFSYMPAGFYPSMTIAVAFLLLAIAAITWLTIRSGQKAT